MFYWFQKSSIDCSVDFIAQKSQSTLSELANTFRNQTGPFHDLQFKIHTKYIIHILKDTYLIQRYFLKALQTGPLYDVHFKFYKKYLQNVITHHEATLWVIWIWNPI